MKTFLYGFSVFFLVTELTACSKAPDLDTPCPNFGQYCPQTSINTFIDTTVLNKEQV